MVRRVGQTSHDGVAGAVLAEVSPSSLHGGQDQEEELEASPPGHPQKPAQEQEERIQGAITINIPRLFRGNQTVQ